MKDDDYAGLQELAGDATWLVVTLLVVLLLTIAAMCNRTD